MTIHCHVNQEQVVSVCLCDTSGHDDLHINDLLVQEGYAVYKQDEYDTAPTLTQVSHTVSQTTCQPEPIIHCMSQLINPFSTPGPCTGPALLCEWRGLTISVPSPGLPGQRFMTLECQVPNPCSVQALSNWSGWAVMSTFPWTLFVERLPNEQSTLH